MEKRFAAPGHGPLPALLYCATYVTVVSLAALLTEEFPAVGKRPRFEGEVTSSHCVAET